jgi:hypothetical protein
MINVGSVVEVKTFAPAFTGVVLSVTPSVPCEWMPSVSTVGMVEVSTPTGNATSVPFDCVRVIL